MSREDELPEEEGHPGRERFQWPAALGAGLIAGAVLLIVPRGSPWSALTFFSAVIMGRVVPRTAGLTLLLVWLIHLLVAFLYALIIGRVVAHQKHERAFVAGGLTGLVLYVLNLGAVSLLWPEMRGGEATVVFTHLVFGLIAAGAYRGLLRRRVPVRH